MAAHTKLDFRRSFEKINQRTDKADTLISSLRVTLNLIEKNSENDCLQNRLIEGYDEVLELMGEFSKACKYCRSHKSRARLREHTFKRCCGKYDELKETRNQIEKILDNLDLIG